MEEKRLTVGDLPMMAEMPFQLPEGGIAMGKKVPARMFKESMPKEVVRPNHSYFAVPTPDGKTDWWSVSNDTEVHRIDSHNPELN